MADANNSSEAASAGAGKTAEDAGLPTHIGFIVDGNRRWAREHGLPTLEGHRRGLKQIEKVALACFERGVKYVSAYLFSTENWGRSDEEVSYLMNLVTTNISSLAKRLQKHNVRCLLLGSSDCPRPDIFKLIQQEVAQTADCDGGVFCICFNYGGHREIADAAHKLLDERLRQVAELAQENPAALADLANLPADLCTVSEETFASYLYHPEVPPLDLLVRTSGEERISGFLLWRAAYAEMLFLERHFPDMEAEHVDEVIAEYQQRQRRFGK